MTSNMSAFRCFQRFQDASMKISMKKVVGTCVPQPSCRDAGKARRRSAGEARRRRRRGGAASRRREARRRRPTGTRRRQCAGEARGVQRRRDGVEVQGRRDGDGGGGGCDLADGQAAARFGGGRAEPGRWRLLYRVLLHRVPDGGSAKFKVQDGLTGTAAVSPTLFHLPRPPAMASSPAPPTPRRPQSPADLADDVLREIFLHLDSPADLARASAACAHFRRVIADHGFLRRYHALHPPPLLGILANGFIPAQPPHPSAVAAGTFAQADAADFSFSFLPSPHRWRRRDSRDGRFLLSAVPVGRGHKRGDLVWITDLVVCDPVHRRYLLLPAIPVDLAAAVHPPDIVDFEPFLAPAAEDYKDTSFRVICLAQCATKLVLFVFSSSVERWHSVTFDGWGPLISGFGDPASGSELSQRYYAHRCFCWLMHRRNMVLVLNTCGMNFSTLELPHDYFGREIAIVEAGEGKLGMFSLCSDITHDTVHLSYVMLRDGGEDANQWQSQEILPLPSRRHFDIVGVAGGYLLLQGIPEGMSLINLPQHPNIACFSLELRTMQLEWFCQTSHSILFAELYAGHPPSLSPPTV